MGENWEFASGDADTEAKWSEKTIRDYQKKLVWTPYMKGIDKGFKVRHPDMKTDLGIITVHTTFKGHDARGRSVTLRNMPPVGGRGLHGDGILKNLGQNRSRYTMSLAYENVANQVFSDGKLNEKQTVGDWREETKDGLGTWAANKTEGAITLALWGLETYHQSNLFGVDVWNTTEEEIYRNPIQAYDSDHILYAGDATSNSDIDSADIMSCQLLTKLRTMAEEDLSIPIMPVTAPNSQPGYVLFTPYRGLEQLQYDDDWVNANKGTDAGSGRLIRGAVGEYNGIQVIPYGRCPKVSANVGQSVLCGADALQLAEVEDFSWFEDYAVDTRKRRAAISIGAMMGVAPSYFNSTRRNSIAVRHYVRS